MKKLLATFLAVSLFNVSVSVAGNVALNKPAWATAELYGLASNAVDGDLQTNWNTGIVGSIDSPLVLNVDLEDTYLVNKINLYADTLPEAGRYISYNLFSSTDQTSWTLINSGDLVSISNPWPQQLDFEPTSMRYLRYEVSGGTIWAHLYEMQVYEVPEPMTLSLLGLGGLFLRRRK